MKKLIILAALFVSGCTRYVTPERAANPTHRYEIRTTKGERQMTRLMRRATFHKSAEGCGY